jgi:hypothetical protein
VIFLITERERWAENVAHTGKMKNEEAYTLVGKPQETTLYVCAVCSLFNDAFSVTGSI